MGDIELLRNPALRELRMQKVQEAAAYIQGLWNARLGQAPATDLLSLMIHSESRSRMDPREFMGNLILLIVGGNDTTRNSKSGVVYALDAFPGEPAKLEANPSLIPIAVSEIIRWQTPLAHMARTAIRDTELRGRNIDKGDKLVLWYLSANRDETAFGSDADAFRVDRPNARRHLAFGYGIDRCVGARLAELQIAILPEEMAVRRMRVSVAFPRVRIPGCFVHGYRSPPVMVSNYASG